VNSVGSAVEGAIVVAEKLELELSNELLPNVELSRVGAVVYRLLAFRVVDNAALAAVLGTVVPGTVV